MAKILIVDDSLTIVKTLEAILKESGYHVIIAQDGVQGLEIAQKEVPDLIILDIMLPKLNGYEVCNMLKMDTSYSHIKILMFTAKMSDNSKNLSMETGADYFLTKETDPEIIIEKVNNLLKKNNG